MRRIIERAEELLTYRILELHSDGSFYPKKERTVDNANVIFANDQVIVWCGSTKCSNFNSLFIKFDKVCYQFNLNESSIYLLQNSKWEFVANKRVINETIQKTLLELNRMSFDNTEANIRLYGLETIFRYILIAISLIRAKHQTINSKFFDYDINRSYFRFVDWFIKEHTIFLENEVINES